MKPEIRKGLYDVLTSIDSIDWRDFFEFQNNKLLRRGIEREIEIIGEAMSRILKINPDFPIRHGRRIVDTRNWVIHAYDNVDDVILWGIVTNHLPLLKDEIKELTKGK